MELICEKYREKMPRKEAYCRHPGEYCKFRSACIIHFLGQERGRDGAAEAKETGGSVGGPVWARRNMTCSAPAIWAHIS